jgi:hypothetical protein
MHRIVSIVALIVVASQPGSAGQQTESTSVPQADTAVSLKVPLPSEFELLLTRYRFENDGTGQKEVIAKIRILNEMGAKQQAEQTFEYHPLSQKLRIPYARVKKRDGTVVNIETNVVQSAQAGVTQDSDLDERNIRIPGLSVGDQVEYDVITRIYRPLGPGEFYAHHYFQATEVLVEQLEVDLPAEKEVKVKSRPDLKFWNTAGEGRKTYHWENQSPTATQALAIPYIPGRTPDVQVSSFLSWEEVGRWYSDLEKNHRVPSAEIKAKADELTKSSKSDLQKVEALYNFAAKRIRYMSLISFGIGGSEPHSASETLHNAYGDCKDKTALLDALLEAEGMHASSVLISGDRELDRDIPSPWPFDHVIAMLQVGKEEIWMDPSSAVLRFRTLAYPLRGKQGLVMFSDGVSHLEKTPAEAPVPNIWSEEIEGKIGDKGELDATVRITAQGDAELPLRQALLSPSGSARPWAVESAVMGIDRNDKVTEVKMSDPTATNEPFVLSFRVNKPFFIRVWEKQSAIRLPLSNCRIDALGGYATTGWDTADSTKVRLGPPRQCQYKIRIEFFQNFTAALPKAVALQSDYASYKANYEIQGNILTATCGLATYTDDLSPSLAKDYDAFRRQLVEASGIAITVANLVPEAQK